MSALHVRRLAVFLPTVLLLTLTACGEEQHIQGAIPLDIHEVTDAGFMSPGAVLADTIGDVYLVSNINGTAGEQDGNGFISRLSPEGEVLDLQWIAPAGERALNSPQGMALRGDSLFVADLACIRIFHRESGEDLGNTCLDDVSHITDVDVGPEGSIFIVDSGLEFSDAGPVATGTDAVYRLVLGTESRGSTLARSSELGNPQGIAVGRRGIFVTTSESGEIFRLTPSGDRTDVFPASDRHLTGIVFLTDGGFAFSSWSDEAIFLVTGEGQVVRLLEGVQEPGGIGFDPSRNRLIVPLQGLAQVLFLDMPADAAASVPSGQ
jgi:hypothetical protein